MITWFMLFTVFMDDRLWTYSTFTNTYKECNEIVETMTSEYSDEAVPLPHMTGRCVEVAPKTLEFQGQSDGPVPLK